MNGAKTDVPVARQTHIVGHPIPTEALRAMPYAARRQAVAEAIDALGADIPSPPADTPTCVTQPGARIVEVLEGALANADPSWAARVRAVGMVTTP